MFGGVRTVLLLLLLFVAAPVVSARLDRQSARSVWLGWLFLAAVLVLLVGLLFFRE
jgi:hypothetical protein